MDDQNKPDKQPVDLASLYPVPKTYDELQQRNQEQEQRRIERQPKFLPFGPVVSLSVSLIVLVVAATYGAEILRLGILGGAAAILMGLLWIGFTGLQVTRLSDFFAQKGSGSTPFFIAYSVSAVPLVAACFALLRPVLPLPFIYVLLLLINAALLHFLAAVVVAKSLSNPRKLMTMLTVVILSIALAIAAVLV